MASKFNFLIVPQKEESLKPIMVAEREGEKRERRLSQNWYVNLCLSDNLMNFREKTQGFRVTLDHARIFSSGPSHRPLLSSDLGKDWG